MSPQREKILILENDDFLREILGNLLHKNGFFVINSYSIEKGLRNTNKQTISRVIVGSSCTDFNNKSTIHHLRKELGSPRIFLINTKENNVDYLPKQDQIQVRNLSIQTILNRVSE